MGEEPEPECKDFKVVERDITDSRTSKRIKTEVCNDYFIDLSI